MKFVVAMLLALGASKVLCFADGQASSDECVSRQEFESLKNDLHYWQNATLTIIKNNIRENSQCQCQEDIEAVRNVVEGKLDTAISSLMNSSQPMMPDSFPVGSFLHPAASCKNIPSSNPSGHYWIQSTSTGYATMEYCHMSPPCSCTASSGWMRVAQLDMTDPSEHCPSGFRTKSSPKRLCSRPSGPGCASTTFTVNGVRYSKVCGKVIGYQFATLDAFSPYYINVGVTLDNVYVDGVSLTHGNTPRQHIWTFANAGDEIQSDHSACPCTKTDSTYTGLVPPFIGNDYFCETGSRYANSYQWYTADPVWDGEGCGATSTCCEFNSPPWFCKDLPQPTTDDIELRLCSDQVTGNEDTGLETIEIYVQ